jgi:N-acyl-D-aspartate/D-glutamate deacylase
VVGTTVSVLVRGGWVVDGTGAPGRRADVLAEDGKIVAIRPDLEARAGATVIDAEGMTVCPGFVDVHTHYDAQLLWDSAATPSIQHGVTTVLAGNCGFSIAPITQDAAEYLIPMLATVEGMPVKSLRAGVQIKWSSFGEYLQHLDGQLVVNAGFSVGHSAVRRVVMGEAAVGEQASEAQMAEMVRLVHESIEQGAIGFSTSTGEGHIDHEGQSVPSRHASMAEILALCRAAGDHPGTSLEIVPTIEQSYGLATQLQLAAMSLAGRRIVNWNALTLEQDNQARHSRLIASDFAAAAGGRVVALAPCVPMGTRQPLDQTIIWSSMPNWPEVMNLPLPERVAAFSDPQVRARLRDGAKSVTRRWADFANYTVGDVQNPELHPVVGRRIADIAEERRADPFDVLCDIAVADGLHAGLVAPIPGSDDDGWRKRVQMCRDERVVIGASDAGAHLDMIWTFAMYTTFLGEAVHKRALLSMEEAVRMITQVPAALYGLRGRGTLAVGNQADIVVFDPAEIGGGTVEPRTDLPGGGMRLYSEPSGIRSVIVNGVPVVEAGSLTGATPGTVLRSGKDTDTPDLAFAS